MKINNNKIKSLFLLGLSGSSSAKETNQTEIVSLDGVNSLPKLTTNLTEGANNSNQTLIFAGMPIFFRDETIGDQGRCVAGFSLVPSEANNPADCDWLDGDGFLTSAFCCKAGDGCGVGNHDGSDSVFLVADNPQEIGAVGDTSLGVSNIDFGFVSIDDGFQLIPYVMEEKILLPVMGLGSVALGDRVCAYGVSSGYLCGNVVEIGLSIPTGREINFEGVNKVDLGDYGFENDNDLGGPVYTVSNIGDRTVAQALGHITSVDNNDKHHKFIYYTPIEKALEMLNEQDICSYNLMIYNETNAQEYDQLIAQVEIPAKK